MRIEYKISYRDYLEAQKAVLGSRLRFMWILGGVFIVFGLLQLSLSRDQYPTACALMIMGAVFLFCWRLSVRRMYRQDERFKQTYFMTSSQEGMEISGPNGSSKYVWPAFIGHKQTKNTIILFQSPSMFNAFPKSAFGESDLLLFANLVQQHVPRHTQKGNRIRTVLFLIVVTFSIVLLLLAIRNIVRQRDDSESSCNSAVILGSGEM